MELPDRWAVDAKPLQTFAPLAYLKKLFTANAGYYRIIVFIVTPHPFSQSDAEVTENEATAWLRGGVNVLPQSIGDGVYSERYTTTALIYEYERIGASDEPLLKTPGRLPAQK